MLASMLGKEIRRRRKALDWSQDRLARKARITPHSLSSIETGKRDPSISTIEALAGALGISAAELLGGVKGLTAAGVEAAKLFERLPEPAREVVVNTMRLLAVKK